MFGSRTLDVYQCAVTALPLAYRLAERADAETKRQLERAALSINPSVAEGTGRLAKSEPLEELLVRIVAMLTNMAAR